jgi:hypothetical protein
VEIRLSVDRSFVPNLIDLDPDHLEIGEQKVLSRVESQKDVDIGGAALLPLSLVVCGDNAIGDHLGSGRVRVGVSHNDDVGASQRGERGVG